MRKRILLRALERMTPYRKDITARHIAGLMDLTEKKGSKELSLPYGIRAVKEYDLLYLRRTAETDSDTGQQVGDGDSLAVAPGSLPEICVAESALTPGIAAEFEVPGTGGFTFILWEAAFLPAASFFYRKEQNIPENRYTKWFDYDKITTSLLLRTRRQGDYMTIDEAMHTKTVKQYMINEKIPKMQRDSMHLLADGSHVLWIPGYRISQKYKVEESTERILEVRLEGGSNGGTNRSVVE